MKREIQRLQRKKRSSRRRIVMADPVQIWTNMCVRAVGTFERRGHHVRLTLWDQLL